MKNEPFFFILKQSYVQIVLVQIVRVHERKKNCQLKRQCRNYNQLLQRFFFSCISLYNKEIKTVNNF